MRVDMRVRDTISAAVTYKLATMAVEVGEAFYNGAQEVEAYAQQNAPWSDITGDARAGLTAEVGVDPGGFVTITLGHTVEYGIWLELIQDGAFAIIMPTLEHLGPKILRDAGASVFRIDG